MDVEFTVNLIPNQLLDQPWAENDEYIMVSGIGGSLDAALHIAIAGLSNWLKSYYRLNASEIATVLGPSIHYDVAEVVDPQAHVVAFATERPTLRPLPHLPFNTVMVLERGFSRDGMVSYNGNAYSVPDGVRGQKVEIQVSLAEVQIFAGGKMVAAHPLREGRHERGFSSDHRRWPPPGGPAGLPQSQATVLTMPGERVARRSLKVYERIGAALAGQRR